MDVIADFLRLFRAALFHGLIRDSKACVHSHHAGNKVIVLGKSMAGKINIFLDCGIRLFLSVTVGNLIAKSGTHAELSCGFFDSKERALDFSKGSVVIENGGYSILNTLQISSFRRDFGELIIQIPVNGPPKSI